MSEYIITTARYANADQTSVVATTSDLGDVLMSQKDRPVLWQKLQDWVLLGNSIGPYVPPAIDPRLVADETERQACKVDATIMPLIDQTKAEWITWAAANFPSLTAGEKNKLGQLFWVVAIGVRRQVRNGQ